MEYNVVNNKSVDYLKMENLPQVTFFVVQMRAPGSLQALRKASGFFRCAMSLELPTPTPSSCPVGPTSCSMGPPLMVSDEEALITISTLTQFFRIFLTLRCEGRSPFYISFVNCHCSGPAPCLPVGYGRFLPREAVHKVTLPWLSLHRLC